MRSKGLDGERVASASLPIVCYSPQADLVGGIVIGAIGIDALRHVDHKNDHLALASLPLLLVFTR